MGIICAVIQRIIHRITLWNHSCLHYVGSEHGIMVVRYMQQVLISPVPYFVSQGFFIAPEAISARGLAINLLGSSSLPPVLGL